MGRGGGVPGPARFEPECSAATSHPGYCYLQNGQMPVPPSLVAAAAVVANSAKAAAVSANSFDFMIISFRFVAVHPLQFYDKR